MADDVEMEYYSDYHSETEDGLEEQYYSAKEVLGSGTVEEALIAMETIVEMDVERTKWGFKALKQIVKLFMRENRAFTDYYKRLFLYIEAKSITTNDVDKSLDSLWNRFCQAMTDEEGRRTYCLITFSGIKSLRARTTRLKWAARLAQQCKPDEYPSGVEELVDDVQLLTQEADNMESISDNVKQWLFESLVMTSRIFLKLKRTSALEGNVDRLKELVSEMDSHVDQSVSVKELQWQVAFVRGKYADAFKLLWDVGKLYNECGSSHSQRVHLQLRLMTLLLPTVGISVPRLENTVTPDNPVWTEQCALVEDIVQCFQKDDVIRLRSELVGAEAKLGRFTAVEICGALLRNRMSRRMASDNWLDSLACLSRWNVDALKLVGRSMLNFVDNHTRALPLKNITSVRVESAHADQTVRDCPPPSAETSSEIYHEYRLRTSVHNGTLSIQTQCESVLSVEGVLVEEEWKTFATVATAERFHDYSWGSLWTRSITRSAISCLRMILANAFVEQFDWASNFSWPDSWQKEHLPTFHIKRLNHAFDTQRPRLLPLRSLGDVSVQLLEVNVQSWGWSFNKDLRNLFEPLKDTKVEKLSVNCDWVAADTEEVSFVDACFAPHSTGPAPHFVVRNARIRRDFLVRMVDRARQSLCECDVYLEMITYTDNFTHLDSVPPDCIREDVGQLRIFNFDWPTNSLRIELEPYKLVARYSWKRHGD